MAWTAPSTWVAAAVLTAAQLNQQLRDNLLALSDRVQVVRKVAGTNINNSTTLTNDAELKFTAVAGQSYVFQFNIVVGTTSNTIDLQVAFSFPTGTLNFGVAGVDSTATATNGTAVFGAIQTATSGATPITVGAINGTVNVLVTGSFLCTTGGTVNLMLAQATLTATNVLIAAGSNMTAFRVAV